LGRKEEQNFMGGQAVDYEKISAGCGVAMKTADLHRFLGVCALVSDLYLPGYKPSNRLRRTPTPRTANPLQD